MVSALCSVTLKVPHPTFNIIWTKKDQNFFSSLLFFLLRREVKLSGFSSMNCFFVNSSNISIMRRERKFLKKEREKVVYISREREKELTKKERAECVELIRWNNGEFCLMGYRRTRAHSTHVRVRA